MGKMVAESSLQKTFLLLRAFLAQVTVLIMMPTAAQLSLERKVLKSVAPPNPKS